MYEKILQDIYGIFSTVDWAQTNCRAYPANYDGIIESDCNFLRLYILPSNGQFETFNLGKRITGILIMSIHTISGHGDKELFIVADKLDNLLQGKTLTNGTQFGPSRLTNIGLDSTDNTYYRGDYTINFTIHGE
jgi:hypothetical protein